MTTYRNDFAKAFIHAQNLFTALSSCFSLLCLLGGLMNGYLIKKNVGAEVMRGVIVIDQWSSESVSSWWRFLPSCRQSF